ncbi:MAG: hypothetical protein GY904_30560, partial [Planctomycetaceae bacterium]|nr:hypothetical protein [Planctomycetaceae bacterium]
VTVGMNGVELVRYLTSSRGFMSADDPVLHFGLGDCPQVEHVTVDWPSGIRQRFEDVKANQLVTITEGTEGQVTPQAVAKIRPLFADATSSGLDVKHTEMEYDDFQHQPLLPNKLSQLGPGLAWGDVNKDGLEDCYFGAAVGSTGKLLMQTSAGQFGSPQKLADSRSF